MSKDTNIQTEGLCKEVTACVINAYEKGYKRGFKEGEDIEQSNAAITKEEVAKMEYERGLNDAWKCFETIINLWKDNTGGIRDFNELFNSPSLTDIFKYSASEAIDKIKKYEKNKKSDKIKVGDEIIDNYYGKGIVTRVCNNTLAITWIEDGTNGVIHVHTAKKTGKHYDCIAEIFKDISEEE